MVSNAHNVSVHSPAPRASCLLSNLTVDIVSLSCSSGHCFPDWLDLCLTALTLAKMWTLSKCSHDLSVEVDCLVSPPALLTTIVVRESILINLYVPKFIPITTRSSTAFFGRKRANSLIKAPGVTNRQTDWMFYCSCFFEVLYLCILLCWQLSQKKTKLQSYSWSTVVLCSVPGHFTVLKASAVLSSVFC